MYDTAVDRLAVQQVAARAHDDLGVIVNAEPVGDVGRGSGFGDGQHVHLGSGADLGGLGVERRIAFLAVALSEAVRRQPTNRRPGSDVHTATMLGRRQTFVLQQAQRFRMVIRATP